MASLTRVISIINLATGWGASEICIIVRQHVIRQHFGNWLTIGFGEEQEELSVGADGDGGSRGSLCFSRQTSLVSVPQRRHKLRVDIPLPICQEEDRSVYFQ